MEYLSASRFTLGWSTPHEASRFTLVRKDIGIPDGTPKGFYVYGGRGLGTHRGMHRTEVRAIRSRLVGPFICVLCNKMLQ